MADLARVQQSLMPDIATLSHVGHARQHNQDYFFNQPEHGLSVVADGVGGQGDGAWASRLAVRQIADGLDRHGGGNGTREAVLLTTLQTVHAAMRVQNEGRAGKPSGTTIAGLWAPPGMGGAVTAFNVGDSPVLHFSDGNLKKVSRDHSLYQLWLDGGQVGKEPGKRMIVQAVGISERLSPHIVSFSILPGDAVLICTDGMSIDPARMSEFLVRARNAQNACDMLLEDALAGAARDNVTVSVCFFQPGPRPLTAP